MQPVATSICLALVIGATLAGCELGTAARAGRSSDEPQQVVDRPPGTPSQASLVPTQQMPLADRVASHRAMLRRFIPGDNLIEHLYFAWMFEPYRRATLAVAVKTVRVLDREVKLRRRGADTLTDEQVAIMLGWLDGVFARDWSPKAPAFKPHRVEVDWDQWLAPSKVSWPRPRSLFAFADRSTFTQADRWFGDFDLLACAGFRVYPGGRNRPLAAGDVAALREHADALRIGLVDAPLTSGRRSLSAESDLTARVQPVTLGELLGRPDMEGAAPAVIDPPRGESWAGMLARRALHRGATGGGTLAMGCVPPRGDPRQLRARVNAAMWVQALDRQRLGIIEGWRDVRDGTATPYRSQFANPAYLESVAHTALDLLRKSQVLEKFSAPPELAIIVGPAHLRDGDDNLWSADFLTIVDALMARQVSFDLIPAGDGPTAGHRIPARPRYVLVMELPDLPSSALADTIVAALRENAPTFRRMAFTEADGGIASGLFVRPTSDGSGVAVVNLIGVRRSLRLVSAAGDRLRAGLTDCLTGEAVGRGKVTLAPYQVRILLP